MQDFTQYISKPFDYILANGGMPAAINLLIGAVSVLGYALLLRKLSKVYDRTIESNNKAAEANLALAAGLNANNANAKDAARVAEVSATSLASNTKSVEFIGNSVINLDTGLRADFREMRDRFDRLQQFILAQKQGGQP